MAIVLVFTVEYSKQITRIGKLQKRKGKTQFMIHVSFAY